MATLSENWDSLKPQVGVPQARGNMVCRPQSAKQNRNLIIVKPVSFEAPARSTCSTEFRFQLPPVPRSAEYLPFTLQHDTSVTRNNNSSLAAKRNIFQLAANLDAPFTVKHQTPSNAVKREANMNIFKYDDGDYHKYFDESFSAHRQIDKIRQDILIRQDYRHAYDEVPVDGVQGSTVRLPSLIETLKRQLRGTEPSPPKDVLPLLLSGDPATPNFGATKRHSRGEMKQHKRIAIEYTEPVIFQTSEQECYNEPEKRHETVEEAPLSVYCPSTPSLAETGTNVQVAIDVSSMADRVLECHNSSSTFPTVQYPDLSLSTPPKPPISPLPLSLDPCRNEPWTPPYAFAPTPDETRLASSVEPVRVEVGLSGGYPHSHVTFNRSKRCTTGLVKRVFLKLFKAPPRSRRAHTSVPAAFDRSCYADGSVRQDEKPCRSSMFH